ncbi:IS21 family transposase [Sorangium sp. So ce363]|uniref:IS21 family transposase n=1 Tax=Sorangium sp. So ce363 TaxID=3133304 RepID=UPI003F62212A
MGRTHRQTAASNGTSPGAVGNVLARAKAAGLTTWEQVTQLDDEALQRALYGTSVVEPGVAPVEPDCAWIHRERHRPHVTLELLHLEYLRQHPNGLRYTAFCNRYPAWLARRGLVMRQVHVAGEKMFVDYAGKKPTLVDSASGAVTEVELFVAVLGASSYTYAEATRSQRGPDWIGSHCRACAFFGGVPRAVVCDELKSGVTRACRYEPQVQRTYEEMASHYGTTVLPARPKHPRDKAKVAVQVVKRWIFARIHNEVFHSLAALNVRIADAARRHQQPCDETLRREPEGALREAREASARAPVRQAYERSHRTARASAWAQAARLARAGLFCRHTGHVFRRRSQVPHL